MSVHDVTGRQALDAAQVFRLLEENPGDVTTVSSRRGVHLYVSPSCQAMLGWEPGQLIGHSADELVHPDHVARWRRARVAALRSPRVAVSAQRLRRADGSYLWTESVSRRVGDPWHPGDIVIISSVRDIADRPPAPGGSPEDEHLAGPAADGTTGAGAGGGRHFPDIDLALDPGPAPDAPSGDGRATERMLRRAIDEERLRVEYQPIVDLRTGRMVSVEALMRVQGIDGLMLPATFIDVAESSGLLVAMDQWLMDQAVEQAAAWERDLVSPDFRGIAINLTARHLAEHDFARTLGDTLAGHGLPPGCISVEVTERVLMEGPVSAMTALRSIRRLGVAVGLDDFGAGYSSLAFLRRFPLDFVKIDPSFVRQLGERPEDSAVVTAIIELAHALHLTVVAVGVETAEQLRLLVDLGCDRAQGFLFSRSGQADSIAAMVYLRQALR